MSDSYWQDENRSGIVVGLPDPGEGYNKGCIGIPGTSMVLTIRGEDFQKDGRKVNPPLIPGFLAERFCR